MSNADLLDSIHGSASREANKFLALGADAMFPDGAVRNIQGGLDADKSASPVRGDMYIAWDTGRVYACFTAGTWTDITCVVGDVRLMAYNYSINEHKHIAIDPDTKAIMIKGDIPAVVDHGALGGLADDDHTQYYNLLRHTKALHDALGLDHGSLSGLGDDDHTQYLLKSGGTMVGLLTLSGAPTVDLHAATKKYVDDQLVTKELFFGRLTTNFTMTTGGTVYKIPVNVADVDTLSGFSSANKRYVIQHSGYFDLVGQIWIDGVPSAGVNQGYQAFIRINGASRESPCTHKQYWMSGWDWWRYSGTTGDLCVRAKWGPKHLDAGDYVELNANAYVNNVVVQGTEPYCGHKTYLSVEESARD